MARFREAHAFQHAFCPAAGGAAVASHGGDDERLAPAALQLADKGLHHQGLV
ncbi:MAG: hypothetical protein MZV63_03505 [Marinilabiliales bacterium]|nr:hypothetical protein [Marinilabiliales bacterium]